MADYTYATMILIAAVIIGLVPVVGGIGLILMTILYMVFPAFLGDWPMQSFQGAFFAVLLALIIINIGLSIPFLLFYVSNDIIYILLFIIHIFIVLNFATAAVGFTALGVIGVAVYVKRDKFSLCRCKGLSDCKCDL